MYERVAKEQINYRLSQLRQFTEELADHVYYRDYEAQNAILKRNNRCLGKGRASSTNRFNAPAKT